jgi:hypothetical protein
MSSSFHLHSFQLFTITRLIAVSLHDRSENQFMQNRPFNAKYLAKSRLLSSHDNHAANPIIKIILSIDDSIETKHVSDLSLTDLNQNLSGLSFRGSSAL